MGPAEDEDVDVVAGSSKNFRQSSSSCPSFVSFSSSDSLSSMSSWPSEFDFRFDEDFGLEPSSGIHHVFNSTCFVGTVFRRSRIERRFAGA